MIGWKQFWVQFGAGGTTSRQVESVMSVSPGTHAAEPTETIAGDTAFAGWAMVAKPVPVIVIWVPLGPLLGSTDVIVGAADASNVKADGSVADCPSGRVTLTDTAPAACAGVVAVIVVASRTAALAAAAPPNETFVPVLKLVPVSFTDVPPRDGPVVFPVRAVTVGAGTSSNVKASVFVALPPPRLVTCTATTPAGWAGVFTVSCVPSSETETSVPAGGGTCSPVAAANATRAPGRKPAPVTVTVSRPSDEPEFGETELIDGAVPV